MYMMARKMKFTSGITSSNSWNEVTRIIVYGNILFVNFRLLMILTCVIEAQRKYNNCYLSHQFNEKGWTTKLCCSTSQYLANLYGTLLLLNLGYATYCDATLYRIAWLRGWRLLRYQVIMYRTTQKFQKRTANVSPDHRNIIRCWLVIFSLLLVS